MNKDAKILLGTALVAIVGGILLFAMQPKALPVSDPVDGSLLIREGSHTSSAGGIEEAKLAKVQIVEFGDYQCPACAAAHPAIKKIAEEYKDNPNVTFVFRHFPLSIHPNARISAQSAEAAGSQGKFWEMHDMIYENQDEWSDVKSPIDIFVGYAEKLGLDTDKFRSEVKNNQYSAIVSADYKDGDELGVNSTPTFFINGVKFGNGVSSYESFKEKIEELLK